jgi:hypothetical protein
MSIVVEWNDVPAKNVPAEMESNGIMKDFCTDLFKIRIDA